MSQNFIPSSRMDNIFYGDIFSISNNVCLIFGYGKTEACKIATNDKSDDQIALDFACLTTDDKNSVYGHFEPHVRGKNIDDPIKHKRRINCFIRMLDSNETEIVLSDNPHLKNDGLSLIQVDYEFFVRLSDFNITYTAESMMPSMVEGVPISEQDPQKRRENFLILTYKADLPCFIALWTDSVEEKANILKRDLALS